MKRNKLNSLELGEADPERGPTVFSVTGGKVATLGPGEVPRYSQAQTSHQYLVHVGATQSAEIESALTRSFSVPGFVA